MMNKKPFSGTWINTIPTRSDVEYKILYIEGRHEVTLTDKHDGEKANISNVIWDRGVLSFNSLWLSTNRYVHNRLKYVSDDTLELFVSFTQIYTIHTSKRIGENYFGEKVSANSEYPFVGIWIGEKDDMRYEYTIIKSLNGFEVRIVDFGDGEELEISNIDWNGDRLAFDAVMSSTGEHGAYRIKSISSNKNQIVYTMKMTESLKRDFKAIKARKEIYYEAKGYALDWKPSEAIQIVDEYLNNVNHKDVEFLLLKGSILEMMLEFEKAIKVYQKLLRIDKDNVQALIDLADCYYNSESEIGYKKAIKYYNRALNLNESGKYYEDKEYEFVYATVGKANVYVDLNKPKKALDVVIKGLAKYPTSILLSGALETAQEKSRELENEKHRREKEAKKSKLHLVEK